MDRHCETCVCGRRAPVQADATAHLPISHSGRKPGAMPAGTVSWDEHVLAHAQYQIRCRSGQSADRIAERGGFSYGELVEYLGRAPETWAPWGRTG